MCRSPPRVWVACCKNIEKKTQRIGGLAQGPCSEECHAVPSEGSVCLRVLMETGRCGGEDAL